MCCMLFRVKDEDDLRKHMHVNHSMIIDYLCFLKLSLSSTLNDIQNMNFCSLPFE